MILSKKVRLRPTPEQEQKLWQSAGTARYIYNYTLAKQEENYKNGGKFISDNDIRKEITLLKQTELSWLNEVSNNVAKPKFKSRKRTKPSFYNDCHKLKVKSNW
jgi:putative transposase